MKKNWIPIIVVIIIIIVIAVFYKPAPKGTIKIGAILPLTGQVSFLGEGMQNAIELAVDEINSIGGVNGRMLEIIYEDSKTEGDEAVTAANKLINIDKVPIMIVGITYEVLPVAPIAEQSNVLLLSPCSSNPAVTNAGDYIFRNMASDVDQGKYAAQFVYNELGLKKVAILYTQTDWGLSLKEAFNKTLDQLGGDIVIEEGFSKEAIDLRTQLVKIKDTDAEIIFFLGDPANTKAGFRQMVELGINLPVIGGALWDNPGLWQELGNLVEGAMYVKVTTPESAKLNEFQSKFLQKTGSDKVIVCSPQAYDLVKILANALKKAGVNSMAVKDELYKVRDYEGVSGDITFDENGDLLNPEMATFIIKDGHVVPYEE
ncbi:ABC transporter substrate-binding protein [Patescibacteria group bacterium]|nr:ABC transporter substrate-binding protein [Patescibacteria group bacterium]MBU4458599.1 ABC transporter substrate-binding protein [Patescibacteria group bacterium]MCG2696264.1 ABC transporter substrate-binding protein [Candidatus Portnoybacteria bacterium]